MGEEVQPGFQVGPFHEYVGRRLLGDELFEVFVQPVGLAQILWWHEEVFVELVRVVPSVHVSSVRLDLVCDTHQSLGEGQSIHAVMDLCDGGLGLLRYGGFC